MAQSNVLDGRKVANTIFNQLSDAIQTHTHRGHRPPKLAIIQVGDHPASRLYINKKRQACDATGIATSIQSLPHNSSAQMLLDQIEQYNQSTDIDGILLQLPLPDALRAQQHLFLEAINPSKDVDGLHPISTGRLAQGHPKLRPCTPRGIMRLLQAYDIDVAGKHVVVVGASNVVGRPLMLELLLQDATVTLCHSKTQALAKHVARAQILISATGDRNAIDAQWIQANSVVVDVGMHHLPSGRVTGDLDMSCIAPKVAWYTPVPGGVGPMTIAMLLCNTFDAYCHSSKDLS